MIATSVLLGNLKSCSRPETPGLWNGEIEEGSLFTSSPSTRRLISAYAVLAKQEDLRKHAESVRQPIT
jgi:hypothetical protein